VQARSHPGLPLAKQVELRGGKGEVDGEGDVIAEFVPGGVGAEFDAGDLGGPGVEGGRRSRVQY
jgi:hypothetical protein